MSKRVFALLWAAAFLLSSAGDGFGAHACPYHDAPAAEHLADHGASHAPTSEPGSEGHEGPCTCLFACQASVGVALAAAPPVVVGTERVEVAYGPLDHPQDLLIRRTLPYFIPFANAPPSLG